MVFFALGWFLSVAWLVVTVQLMNLVEDKNTVQNVMVTIWLAIPIVLYFLR